MYGGGRKQVRVDAQRRESPTHGGADSRVLGRAKLRLLGHRAGRVTSATTEWHPRTCGFGWLRLQAAGRTCLRSSPLHSSARRRRSCLPQRTGAARRRAGRGAGARLVGHWQRELRNARNLLTGNDFSSVPKASFPVNSQLSGREFTGPAGPSANRPGSHPGSPTVPVLRQQLAEGVLAQFDWSLLTAVLHESLHLVRSRYQDAVAENAVGSILLISRSRSTRLEASLAAAAGPRAP